MRVIGLAGMAGVLGIDEGAWALPVDEGPVPGGLEPVVVAAEPIEEVEDGDAGAGPVVAVVVLEERELVAALGGAGRVEPFEGALLARRWPAGRGGRRRRRLHPW